MKKIEISDVDLIFVEGGKIPIFSFLPGPAKIVDLTLESGYWIVYKDKRWYKWGWRRYLFCKNRETALSVYKRINRSGFVEI